MTEPLLFATSNAGKLAEFRQALGRPVEGAELHLDELQTDDAAVLVRHKAEQAHTLTGRPVLVEDTVLGFDAWGGLPGPFIKFFLERLGRQGLVQALAAFPTQAAEAATAIGFHDGGTVHCFLGRVRGSIVAPRGGHGFGWDAIFQPEGFAHTFAEMTDAETLQCSMRGRALQALAAYLDGAG